AFYPALLAMVVLILARPNARRLLIAYYLGGLTISFVAGALILEAFKAGHAVGASNRSVSPGVDIFAALLALVIFWVLLTGRDRRLRERRERRKEVKAAKNGHSRDPWSARVLERESLGLTFAVALVLNLPGAMYLVALKDIAESKAGTAQTVLWVLLYNLIMFTLIEVPLLGYIASPEATKRRVAAMNAWLGGHGRQIAMGLCATAGAFFLARGLIAAL
ncbi:MAG TPA: GAP family protein, partial [Thermoleophilaceae bacterium]|nr:GAP family protein [Thermoleophilaceae bacterium]